MLIKTDAKRAEKYETLWNATDAVMPKEIRPLNCGKSWEGKYLSLDRAKSFFSCASCGHAR